MKNVADLIPTEELIKAYLELNSSYKVAEKFGVSATAVKRLLKKAGVLRTQSDAAKIRKNDWLDYERTAEHKKRLSDIAKQKTGNKNPFFGKKHSEEFKKQKSEWAKTRTKQLNSNYRHGQNIRRPRDYKYHEFKPLRNKVFNRDNYKCFYCSSGGHLHAHHILPFWVKPEAFLDESNLITVCSECHLKKAHKNSWSLFDETLVTDALLDKYSLNRERLIELANLYKG